MFFSSCCVMMMSGHLNQIDDKLSFSKFICHQCDIVSILRHQHLCGVLTTQHKAPRRCGAMEIKLIRFKQKCAGRRPHPVSLPSCHHLVRVSFSAVFIRALTPKLWDQRWSNGSAGLCRLRPTRVASLGTIKCLEFVTPHAFYNQ